ncbi:hypothetical protein [Maricaulis sp. CAU 1757]
MNDKAQPDNSRFREFQSQLRQAADARRDGYWETRQLESSVEPDCLTVSWTGSQEYWIACEFAACLKAAERPSDDRDTVGRLPQRRLHPRERLRLAEQVRRGYDRRNRHLGFGEAFVFYKASSRLPASLEDLAPEAAHVYRQAPLHHWVILTRSCRPAAGKERNYTAYEAPFEPQRDSGEAIERLLDHVFPARCPAAYGRGWARGDDGADPSRQDEGPEARTALALMVIVVVLTSVIALFLFAPTRQLIRAGWHQIVEVLQPDPLVLAQRRYERLERRRDAVLAALPVDRVALQEIEQEMRWLATEIRQLGGWVETPWDRVGPPPQTGLQPAACLPTRWTAAGQAEGYVYEIHLRSEGLSVTAPDNPVVIQDPRFEGFRAVSRGGMDVAAFERHVRPVVEQAYRAGCRHHVLLTADEWIDPALYRMQLEAVHRNFHVLTPRQ